MKSTPCIEPAELEPPASNTEATSGSGTNAASVDELLQSAEELFKQSEKTRRTLLYQRVELDRVLTQLKEAVGHGTFISEFKNWVKSGRISFSLRTGERAMAYAELEAAGKFVDDDRNDIVSNLAEAERLRKAAEAEKKAKKDASDQKSDGKADDAGPVTLNRSQISTKAKKLARPLLDECRGYDGDIKTELLEELIELLTEELEKCSR